jgi:PAS domain S-box-containing protein
MEIIYWNKGAEKIYGYSSKEAVGCVSHDLLKTVHFGISEDIKSILKRDGAWDGEIEHTTKNGNKLIIETKHQVILNELGQNLVLETNRDITERKKAELQLNEAKSLSESQAKMLSTILNNINDGVVVADANGNLMSMNPSALQLHGFSSLEEYKKIKDFASNYEITDL